MLSLSVCPSVIPAGIGTWSNVDNFLFFVTDANVRQALMFGPSFTYVWPRQGACNNIGQPKVNSVVSIGKNVCPKKVFSGRKMFDSMAKEY